MARCAGNDRGGVPATTPARQLMIAVCEGKSCDYVPSRSVTVSATWVAAGEAQRVNERLLGGGECSTVVHVRGLMQPAAGAVVIDGVAGEGSRATCLRSRR